MKISIIGLGWFGEPLAHYLNDGNNLSGTTRSDEKIEQLRKKDINAIKLNYGTLPNKNFLNSELIVLNIPPFENQLEWFKRWDWHPNTWIIFISSTSKNPLLIEQENWLKTNFKNWTILRFAGLYGNDRHPGKHLSGKKNLKGRLWPVKLLNLDQAILFTEEIIKMKRMHETLDVISLEHPQREKFYRTYCEEQGLPLPEFDPADESLERKVKYS